MGFDFFDSIRRSDASCVFRVDYLHLIKRHGLCLALEKIKIFLLEKEVQVLVFSLDNCFDLPPEFFNSLRPKIFCCMYLGDDEHYFERSARYYAQAFDLTLPSNPLSVYRYSLYNINSLMFPSCFDINEFTDIPLIDCEDVVFVGKSGGKVGREDYINFLDSSNINFASYGSSSANDVVSREKMYSLFRSSRISLNFTGVSLTTPLDSDISINRRVRGVKGRCQKIALCGGFVLSEYVPGIEKLFDIGQEIDVFNSKRELSEKINFYLANPLIRSNMAEKANLKAISKYSDVVVWKKIGEYISIKRSKRSNPITKIYIDSIFSKSYYSFQLSRIIGLAIRLRFKILVNDISILFPLKSFNIKLFIYYLRLDFVDSLRYCLLNYKSLKEKLIKCLKR